MWVRVFLTSVLVLPSVIRGIETEQEEEGASSSDFYQCVPGYIQLPPSSSSLIISPNKLSEASPDSRLFEPHNTIV